MPDQNENLVEYKAGRMNMVGKRVEPEDRKGLIYLRRYAEDNQIHFCWVDRRTGHIEVDVVAEPGSLEFRRIEQCKTGRVYVLRFQQSTRRLFFWLQEPQHENDEKFCNQVNKYLHEPQNVDILDSSKRSAAAAEAEAEADTEAGATDTEGRTRGGGTEDLYLIDEILGPQNGQVASEIFKETNDASSCLALAQPMTLVASPPSTSPSPAPAPIVESSFIDLGLALQMHGLSAISDLLKSKPRMRALVAQLPRDEEDDGVAEEQQHQIVDGSCHLIEEHIRSPQFHEAVAQFSIGLEAGVLGPILEPFALDAEAMAAVRLGDLELFLRVLHQDI